MRFEITKDTLKNFVFSTKQRQFFCFFGYKQDFDLIEYREKGRHRWKE